MPKTLVIALIKTYKKHSWKAVAFNFSLFMVAQLIGLVAKETWLKLHKNWGAGHKEDRDTELYGLKPTQVITGMIIEVLYLGRVFPHREINLLFHWQCVGPIPCHWRRSVNVFTWTVSMFRSPPERNFWATATYHSLHGQNGAWTSGSLFTRTHFMCTPPPTIIPEGWLCEN